MIHLSGLPNFLLYYAASLACLAMFAYAYVRFTPYNEIKLISEGCSSAAFTLSGALLGFAMPLAVACIKSASMEDFLVWALIAAASQMLVFVVIARLFSKIASRIPETNSAAGVFLGSASVVIGLLNAACMAG